MSIFNDIKEHVSARQVAEHYGLKVGRNGMACCPFHDDKHPSMKIDTGYYCFGCGAHGDAVGYVAQLFCLSQYEAAGKIVKDLGLPIGVHPVMDDRKRYKARMKWHRQKNEQDKIISIRERFNRWSIRTVDDLRECSHGIRDIIESFRGASPDEVFASAEFETAVHAQPLIEYWLDILCMGTDEDRIEMFIKGREEVERSVRAVKEAVEGRLERGRADTGCREQHCG